MESNRVRGSRGVSYTSENPGEAWGRYQFRVVAFKEVGMIDSNGNWIEGNKYGVTSFEEFLNDPVAQEKAMEGFLAKYQGYLKNSEVVGEDIEIDQGGKTFTLTITEDGLLAAAHHAGPTGAQNFVRDLIEMD